jgi:hypothetical protein
VLFRSRLLLLGKDVLLFMNVSRVFFFVTYEKSCALFFFSLSPHVCWISFLFFTCVIITPEGGFLFVYDFLFLTLRRLVRV